MVQVAVLRGLRVDELGTMCPNAGHWAFKCQIARMCYKQLTVPFTYVFVPYHSSAVLHTPHKPDHARVYQGACTVPSLARLLVSVALHPYELAGGASSIVAVYPLCSGRKTVQWPRCDQQRWLVPGGLQSRTLLHEPGPSMSAHACQRICAPLHCEPPPPK